MEIIGEQPTNPSKPEKMAAYEKALTEWYADWERLNPIYRKLEAVPQIVLDPFSGAATTGLAAQQLGRGYIGCELNLNYAAMSIKRLARHDAPLFGES